MAIGPVGGKLVIAEGGEAQATVAGGEMIQAQNNTFWASKMAITRNRESGVSLQFYPKMQAADRVVIPGEIWDEATVRFRNALVGFVFGTKPFLSRVKGFARTK
ncbi:hypothetical protein QQ045_022368 [Rhodiola kirilowii]